MDDINWAELERLVGKGMISRRVLLRHLIELGGIAAVIGPGATLLAACGEQKAAGPSGPVPSGFPPINNDILGKKITLTILLAADYYNQAPFTDLYANFQKAYPDITLQVTNAVWEDIPTKVRPPPWAAHRSTWRINMPSFMDTLASPSRSTTCGVNGARLVTSCPTRYRT